LGSIFLLMGEGTLKSRVVQLREVFSRERSFRGADIDLARKASKVGWVLGGTVGYSLLPFYPPTQQIGVVGGWGLTACVSVLTGTWMYLLFRHDERVTFNALLLTAYLGIANVAVEQWLAGGVPAAYHELYPFMICAAAAVHPPRRFFPFALVMISAAVLPEIGNADGGELGDLVIEQVLWLGASLPILALIWRLRQGRADLQSQHSEASELARVDPLTGLGNRRAFEEAFAHETARIAREGGELSLLLCDLDRFKQINDDYGHLAGDDCLRQVGATLRSEVRLAESCFRWGGDEFVVLVNGGDEVVREAGVRLEQAVASTCSRPDGRPLSITTGPATLHDGMGGDELLARADNTLRERKYARQRSASAFTTAS
jgi:diguanylate cyclase (GGDEF)-like protein